MLFWVTHVLSPFEIWLSGSQLSGLLPRPLSLSPPPAPNPPTSPFLVLFSCFLVRQFREFEFTAPSLFVLLSPSFPVGSHIAPHLACLPRSLLAPRLLLAV